jgi:DNA-binding CsgD family transcriptional regulator
MRAPLVVRSLTESERAALRTGLRSPQAFTLRRSQTLLLRAEGETPGPIARQVGCREQTVRNVLRAFEAEALAWLAQQSSRPQTAEPELAEAKGERLCALLHQSPRQCGKARSTWTLQMLAVGAPERGLTKRWGSEETIRNARRRRKVRWKRAHDWLTSPGSQYARKKRRVKGRATWPKSTRRGYWGMQTKYGGVAWLSPGCTVGLRENRCGW